MIPPNTTIDIDEIICPPEKHVTLHCFWMKLWFPFWWLFPSDDLGGTNPSDVDTWLQVNSFRHHFLIWLSTSLSHPGPAEGGYIHPLGDQNSKVDNIFYDFIADLNRRVEKWWWIPADLIWKQFCRDRRLAVFRRLTSIFPLIIWDQKENQDEDKDDNTSIHRLISSCFC